jgi:endonuclease/exonuclease/phosphatase family metal-dependent hydrolase
MTKIRVATFNVRNGRGVDGLNSWPFRRTVTARMIKDLDADVIGLQEVFRFQLRYLMSKLPEYGAFGRSRSGHFWGERCMVLYKRRKIELVDGVTHWYGDMPDRVSRMKDARFPRIATVCRFRFDGKDFVFANTHLDERSQQNRLSSVEQLQSWVSSRNPAIVVGDLNVEPGDEVIQHLQGSGFRLAKPDPLIGSAHQFTGRTDGPLIDHILVNGLADIESCRVETISPDRRLASDHWPVVATVTFP